MFGQTGQNGVENSAGQRSADDRKKQKILTVAEHCRARKGARAKKLAEVEANGAKHADSDKAEAFPLFFYRKAQRKNAEYSAAEAHESCNGAPCYKRKKRLQERYIQSAGKAESIRGEHCYNV